MTLFFIGVAAGAVITQVAAVLVIALSTRRKLRRLQAGLLTESDWNIWNHNSQTTFYGSLKTSNFKALLPEKSLE